MLNSYNTIAYYLASKNQITRSNYFDVVNLSAEPNCVHSEFILPSQVNLLPTDFVVEANKPFSGKQEIKDMITSATRSISLVNPYIHRDTISCLDQCSRDITVRILTNNFGTDRKKRAIIRDIVDLRGERGINIEIRQNPNLHDRFVILDSQLIWHCGSDIKDIGKTMVIVSQIREEAAKQDIIHEFNDLWHEGTPVR